LNFFYIIILSSKGLDMAAKILFLDIETAPETAYIWRRFKETVGQTQIKTPGYLLCMSWAWANTKPQTASIYQNRSWKRGNRCDDKAVVLAAHKLLCEADIVVGHNLRSFDIGTLNARFLAYKLPPPTPYKVCDTIETLKKRFHLPSNSLESASHYFSIKVKDKQPFTLWRDCMSGVPVAWKRLTTYCENDVEVVRQLYYKLIPWTDQHPNMGLYESDGSKIICPKCGSDKLHGRGKQLTNAHTYQRFQCQNCKGWSRSRLPLKIDRSHILTHAVVN
jgi:hypothetical protein